MFFHGSSHEKVMSLYFQSVAAENIKVMAGAKNKKAASSRMFSGNSPFTAYSKQFWLFTYAFTPCDFPTLPEVASSYEYTHLAVQLEA
ncbi:MAG: hypothetical protein IPI60_17050 [Saprospiraceae bacterium]|nr:hypothetical protein [Saprospiraceae bacterium]